MGTVVTHKWTNPHGANPPTPVMTNSGCKVGWNFYRTKSEADACAKWAEAQAEYMSTRGYDFGYQRPGTIVEQDGMFKVTVP